MRGNTATAGELGGRREDTLQPIWLLRRSLLVGTCRRGCQRAEDSIVAISSGMKQHRLELRFCPFG